MGSITEKIEYLQETKEAIKYALIGQGQSVSSADTFRSYADKVASIEGGGGDTSLDDIINILNEGLLNSIVPFYTSEANPTGYTLSYSSQNASSTPAWAIFNNTLTPVTNSTISNVRWTASQALPQWVQIKLPEAKKINAFYIANNKPAAASPDFSCKTYKIQGSNDGTTFTDIYTETIANEAVGKYVALPQESSAYLYYRFVVTESYHSTYSGMTSFFPIYIEDFEKIKLISKTITQDGVYDPADDNADGYDEVVVNVSGAKNILKGATPPTSADGADGDIYLQTGFVLSQFTETHQNAMELISKDANGIEFNYSEGNSIGAKAYYYADLTDIDELYFSISTGSDSYNNYATPRFAPFLCIVSSTSGYPTDADAQSTIGAATRLATANSTKSGVLDVSSYTGSHYIVFNGTGCDCKLNYLGGVDSISAMYCKVNGSWQLLEGTDIDDVNTEGSSGIEPLEYAEVDGTQVFNLGMQLTEISKIVLDFSINSVSQRNNFMGAVAGLIGNNASGKVQMTNGSSIYASSVSITADRHTIEWNRLAQGQYSFKVDDGETTNINAPQSSYSKDLYLMGVSPTDPNKVIGRFYSAEVYNTNNELVMSIVCKKYKNIIIIYDEISNTAIASFVENN